MNTRAKTVSATPPLFTNLVEAQTKLFQDPATHDLIVKCGDKTWRCQQVILSQRCAFFRAACGSGFKESRTKTIVLGDDDPIELESMLLYIYTLTPPAFEDFDKASSAYTLGDKYNLPPFKNVAKEAMLFVVRRDLPRWYRMKDESEKDKWIERVKTLWSILMPDSTDDKDVVIQALIPSIKLVLLHGEFQKFMSENNDFHTALTKALAERVWKEDEGKRRRGW